MNKYIYIFVYLLRILIICTFVPFSCIADQNEFFHFKEYCKIINNKNNFYYDGIAAIVNQDVITFYDLYYEINKNKTSNNYKLYLDKLINNILIKQQAELLNINVSRQELTDVIKNIASNNNVNVCDFKMEIERNGISWKDFEYDLNNQILQSKLRNLMSERITITDFEINEFLMDYEILKKMRKNKISNDHSAIFYKLSQIFIKIPENASNEKIDILYKKAQDILLNLKEGTSFEELAMNNLEYIEKFNDYVLGTKPLNDWPDLFIENIYNLNPGDYTNIIRSDNGFHIIMVVDKFINYDNNSKIINNNFYSYSDLREGDFFLDESALIDHEIHIKHIFMKINDITDIDSIYEKLTSCRDKILSNQLTFEEAALIYSEDAVTSSLGGDLGWLNKKQLFDMFKINISDIDTNDISEIIETQQGLHIIKYCEDRMKDISLEKNKIKTFNFLLNQRLDAIFEDWLDDIKGKSYINIRL